MQDMQSYTQASLVAAAELDQKCRMYQVMHIDDTLSQRTVIRKVENIPSVTLRIVLVINGIHNIFAISIAYGRINCMLVNCLSMAKTLSITNQNGDYMDYLHRKDDQVLHMVQG